MKEKRELKLMMYRGGMRLTMEREIIMWKKEIRSRLKYKKTWKKVREMIKYKKWMTKMEMIMRMGYMNSEMTKEISGNRSKTTKGKK